MTEYLGPFELGKVHCVDANEALKLLPDGCVDAVITDPPYGEKTHAGARLAPNKKQVSFSSMTADALAGIVSVLLGKCRRWIVMTCEWRHMLPLEERFPAEFIRAGVWTKPSYTPQFSGDRPATGWEAIAMLHPQGRKRWNGGGRCSVYRFNTEGGFHETQKPLAMARQFIMDFTNESDIILDPFSGSGTTGVAAVQLGRRFLGFEINQEYCDIANKRIEAARRGITVNELDAGQGALFDQVNQEVPPE
jgi:site-specific DNA-methyltransferase (adenine-specific)